ncbi:unnamed protein product [Amoebophrya sp. A120]|nr:unnamed protein product [Amoebophrya sp. A120]|eukprot:GSA120T00008942001.1
MRDQTNRHSCTSRGWLALGAATRTCFILSSGSTQENNPSLLFVAGIQAKISSARQAGSPLSLGSNDRGNRAKTAKKARQAGVKLPVVAIKEEDGDSSFADERTKLNDQLPLLKKTAAKPVTSTNLLSTSRAKQVSTGNHQADGLAAASFLDAGEEHGAAKKKSVSASLLKKLPSATTTSGGRDYAAQAKHPEGAEDFIDAIANNPPVVNDDSEDPAEDEQPALTPSSSHLELVTTKKTNFQNANVFSQFQQKEGNWEDKAIKGPEQDLTAADTTECSDPQVGVIYTGQILVQTGITGGTQNGKVEADDKFPQPNNPNDWKTWADPNGPIAKHAAKKCSMLCKSLPQEFAPSSGTCVAYTVWFNGAFDRNTPWMCRLWSSISKKQTIQPGPETTKKIEDGDKFGNGWARKEAGDLAWISGPGCPQTMTGAANSWLDFSNCEDSKQGAQTKGLGKDWVVGDSPLWFEEIVYTPEIVNPVDQATGDVGWGYTVCWGLCRLYDFCESFSVGWQNGLPGPACWLRKADPNGIEQDWKDSTNIHSGKLECIPQPWTEPPPVPAPLPAPTPVPAPMPSQPITTPLPIILPPEEPAPCRIWLLLIGAGLFMLCCASATAATVVKENELLKYNSFSETNVKVDVETEEWEQNWEENSNAYGVKTKAGKAALEKRRANKTSKDRDLSASSNATSETSKAAKNSLAKRKMKKKEKEDDTGITTETSLEAVTGDDDTTEQELTDSETASSAILKTATAKKKAKPKGNAVLDAETEKAATDLAANLKLTNGYAVRLAKAMVDPDLAGKPLPKPKKKVDREAMLAANIDVDKGDMAQMMNLISATAGKRDLSAVPGVGAVSGRDPGERAEALSLQSGQAKKLLDADVSDLDSTPSEPTTGERAKSAKLRKKKSKKDSVKRESNLNKETKTDSEKADSDFQGGPATAGKKKRKTEQNLDKEAGVTTESNASSGEKATKASLKKKKSSVKKKLDSQKSLKGARESDAPGETAGTTAALQTAVAPGGKVLQVSADLDTESELEPGEKAKQASLRGSKKEKKKKLETEKELTTDQDTEQGETANKASLRSSKKEKKKKLETERDLTTDQDTEQGETAKKASLRSSKKEKKKALDAEKNLTAESEPEAGESATKLSLKQGKKSKKDASLRTSKDLAAGVLPDGDLEIAGTGASLQKKKSSSRKEKSLKAETELDTDFEITEAFRILKKAGLEKAYARKLAATIADKDLNAEQVPTPPNDLDAQKLEELGFGLGESVGKLRLAVAKTKQKQQALKAEKSLQKEQRPSAAESAQSMSLRTSRTVKKQKLATDQIITAAPERNEVENVLVEAGIGKKYAKKLARKLNDPDLDAVPVPADEKDLSVLQSLGLFGEKESSMEKMRLWAAAAAKAKKKKKPMEFGTDTISVDFAVAEKALLKLGLEKMQAKKLAEKIASPDLNAEETLSDTLDEKSLKLLQTLGFGGSEKITQTAQWIQKEAINNKREETCLTTMTLDAGISEKALLSAGMTAKFAKKLAKQLGDPNLTAEETLAEPDNEKDLQILKHMGIFGDTEKVGTMRGYLHQKLEQKYGVDENGNLNITADITIDFGTSEEAFVQQGFSKKTAKKLAKRVVEKDVDETEASLREDMDEKDLELMEQLYGPGFFDNNPTELNEQMEGFVKRQVLMKQKRISIDLSTMKYADVDFGNAEEIFVLKGFEPLMAKKVAKAVVKNDKEGLAELIENGDSGELAAADVPGQKELLAALAGTGDLKSDVAMDNLKDMLEEEIDNNKEKYAMPEKPILRSRASSKKKRSPSEILVDPASTGALLLPPDAELAGVNMKAGGFLPQRKPKKEPPSAFMQSCCCCFLGSSGQDDEGADDLYNAPAVQVQGGGGESVQPIGIAKPIHLKIEEAATDSEQGRIATDEIR